MERPIRFIEPAGALPFWDLLRHEGGAAAVVTDAGSGRAGCSSSRSPTSRSSTGCGSSSPTGLNVLTGETGAGKSLLIDALGLALGARADTSLVRHGADDARASRRCSTASPSR